MRATGSAGGGQGELSGLGTGTRCLYPHATQHRELDLPRPVGARAHGYPGTQNCWKQGCKYSSMQVQAAVISQT